MINVSFKQNGNDKNSEYTLQYEYMIYVSF